MPNEFDTPIGIDIRTKRPIKEKKPIAPPDTKDKLERQRQANLFKDLMSRPGYEEFRKMAYTLCKPGVNITGLDSGLVWLFRAAMRSGMDYLFNTVENLANTKEPEEQIIVDKSRPSFFADNLNLPSGKL